MAIIPGVVASSISGHLQTNNFFLISQQSVSSGTSVTFSSIPNTYKTLQVRANILCNTTNIGMNMTLNGDTTTTYWSHTLYGNQSSATWGQTSQTSGIGIARLDGSSAGIQNSYPYGLILDLIDYTSTSKFKTIKAIGGVSSNNTNGAQNVASFVSGLYPSTSAITSLTFTLQAGSSYPYISGTTFSLYGVS